MTMDTEELRRLLTLDQYPRAAAYDPTWVMANEMGPNGLWLAEALCDVMPLEPGMRVLDLGCGRAMTSIFLAREFDVEVWAVDLWINATDNWQRIREAGLEGRVHPIHSDAHALPFADEFFDVAVSFDAYEYFGTDDLYLAKLARVVVPGGRLGIVVPGFRDEPEVVPPPPLAPHWVWDMCNWHSAPWWRRHWEKTGFVTVDRADMVPYGWQHWLRWETDIQAAAGNTESAAGLLLADTEQTLGFARITARKPAGDKDAG